LLRRVPRAARVCALLALLNGLAWTLIVPPFEVPDENAHYAYVQQVAERGALPHQRAIYSGLSPREDETLAALRFYQLPGEPGNPQPLTDLEQNQLSAVERTDLSARGSGDATRRCSTRSRRSHTSFRRPAPSSTASR
jgi:hypothetical protein